MFHNAFFYNSIWLRLLPFKFSKRIHALDEIITVFSTNYSNKLDIDGHFKMIYNHNTELIVIWSYILKKKEIIVFDIETRFSAKVFLNSIFFGTFLFSAFKYRNTFQNFYKRKWCKFLGTKQWRNLNTWSSSIVWYFWHLLS